MYTFYDASHFTGIKPIIQAFNVHNQAQIKVRGFYLIFTWMLEIQSNSIRNKSSTSFKTNKHLCGNIIQIILSVELTKVFIC